MVVDAPMSPKTNLALANRYFFTEKDPVKARIYVEKTLELDSGNLEAHKLILHIALKEKNQKEVRKLLEGALKLFPEEKNFLELKEALG